MTGTTHQLIALLAALMVLIWFPLTAGPAVGTLAIIAVMVGALTPDLDQPTANIWRRLLGGRALGHIFDVFSGGHRHLTHALVGIIAIGFLTRWGIDQLLQVQYHAAARTLWSAFMVGYISHPVADTFTDRGVPWLWPLPFHIALPPGPRLVRITTGSLVERLLVRGGLIIVGAVLLYQHWPVLVRFFRS